MNNITIEHFQILGIIAVLLFGGGTLIGVFRRMKGGFGPQNLRVIVIVLVATFVMLAGCIKPEYLNTAIGILGAIIGYIFGISRDAGVQATTENSKTQEDETSR
jgi:Flp pilus assembly pilin Flp